MIVTTGHRKHHQWSLERSCHQMLPMPQATSIGKSTSHRNQIYFIFTKSLERRLFAAIRAWPCVSQVCNNLLWSNSLCCPGWCTCMDGASKLLVAFSRRSVCPALCWELMPLHVSVVSILEHLEWRNISKCVGSLGNTLSPSYHYDWTTDYISAVLECWYSTDFVISISAC